MTFGKGGGLVEVEYIGMGFTLVRRCVYQAIVSKLDLQAVNGGYDGKLVIPFFIPSADDTYLSEDYSFSLRGRLAGWPPMVDTTMKVGHIGKKKYTWDDLAPDVALDSVVVEQNQRGEIKLVDSVERQTMGITKEVLAAELATLDQQKAQCEDGIAAATRVHADNVARLQAVNGAIQLTQHLLKKLEGAGQATAETNGEKAEQPNEAPPA